MKTLHIDALPGRIDMRYDRVLRPAIRGEINANPILIGRRPRRWPGLLSCSRQTEREGRQKSDDAYAVAIHKFKPPNFPELNEAIRVVRLVSCVAYKKVNCLAPIASAGKSPIPSLRKSASPRQRVERGPTPLKEHAHF
jgi:hypothetical protein